MLIALTSLDLVSLGPEDWPREEKGVGELRGWLWVVVGVEEELEESSLEPLPPPKKPPSILGIRECDLG